MVASRRDGDAIPPPIIATNEEPEQQVVRSSVGITIEILRPENVTRNATIYYTMRSSEQDKEPSCGDAENQEKWTKPKGTEYEGSFHFCGDDGEVTILAILCEGVQGSEVASKTLDIRRYEPQPPSQPLLQPVVDSTCAGSASGLKCTVADESEEAQMVLSVADYVCSDPRYGTMADCGGAGKTWQPMRQCQQDVESKPCMDIFYTRGARAGAASSPPHPAPPLSQTHKRKHRPHLRCTCQRCILPPRWHRLLGCCPRHLLLPSSLAAALFTYCCTLHLLLQS